MFSRFFSRQRNAKKSATPKVTAPEEGRGEAIPISPNTPPTNAKPPPLSTLESNEEGNPTASHRTPLLSALAPPQGLSVTDPTHPSASDASGSPPTSSHAVCVGGGISGRSSPNEEDDIVLEEEQGRPHAPDAAPPRLSGRPQLAQRTPPCALASAAPPTVRSQAVRVRPSGCVGLERDSDEDEENEEEDLELTGSTMDEPMTPHSYSSMRLLSESKRRGPNSSVSTLPVRHGSKMFSTFASFHSLPRWSSGNSSPSSMAFRRSEPAVGTDTSPQPHRDDGRPPLPISATTPGRALAVSTGVPTDGMGSGDSPHHRTYCSPILGDSVSEEKSGSPCTFLFQSTRPDACRNSSLLVPPSPSLRSHTAFWASDALPPEPKELIGVNFGRPRSESFKETVVESDCVEKQAVGHHQKLLNDKYVIYPKCSLGVGSYSKLVLCYNLEDKVYYAMKVIDRVRLQRMGIGVDCALHKVKREIAIMKKLRHSNIIALMEVIDDPRSRKIYLILELAEHGEIMSITNDGTVIPVDDNTTLSEREVVRVVRSIVTAIRYAHHLGIAHRDIKPQNILLTAEGDVKLSDFGVSIIVDDSAVRVRREGSVAFLPPEILRSPELKIAPSTICRAATHSRCCSNGTSIASTIPQFRSSVGDNFDATAARSTTTTFESCANTSTTTAQSGGNVGALCHRTTHDRTPSLLAEESVAPVDLFKADVFSLGVTAFVLLTGRLPWRASSSETQLQAILADPDPFEAELRNVYGNDTSEESEESQQKLLFHTKPLGETSISNPFTSSSLEENLATMTNQIEVTGLGDEGVEHPPHPSSHGESAPKLTAADLTNSKHTLCPSLSSCGLTTVDALSLGSQFRTFPSTATDAPPDDRRRRQRARSLPATKQRGRISGDAIDFIRRCLRIDAAERATVEELYEHAWIQTLLAREREVEKVATCCNSPTSTAVTPTSTTTATNTFPPLENTQVGFAYRESTNSLTSPTVEHTRGVELYSSRGESTDSVNRESITHTKASQAAAQPPEMDIDEMHLRRPSPLLSPTGRISEDENSVPLHSRLESLNDMRVSEASSFRSPDQTPRPEAVCFSPFQRGLRNPTGAILTQGNTHDKTLSRVPSSTSTGTPAWNEAMPPKCEGRDCMEGSASAPSHTHETFPHNRHAWKGPPHTVLPMPSEEEKLYSSADLDEAVTRVTNRTRRLANEEKVAVPLDLYAKLRGGRAFRLSPFRRRHFDEDCSVRYSRDDSFMAKPGTMEMKASTEKNIHAICDSRKHSNPLSIHIVRDASKDSHAVRETGEADSPQMLDVRATSYSTGSFVFQTEPNAAPTFLRGMKMACYSRVRSYSCPY